MRYDKNFTRISGSAAGRWSRHARLALLLVLRLSVWVGRAGPRPVGGGSSLATPHERMEKVRQLLSEVPLIDGHNDLPWNIRNFVHNQLADFEFNTDLRQVTPWSKSAWSQTDLPRLREGMVGGQPQRGRIKTFGFVLALVARASFSRADLLKIYPSCSAKDDELWGIESCQVVGDTLDPWE
ncbi:hypothetical protein QAD02_019951 [Eretmocerus hayati]|uniref:Uncharacterized protein n=1 Tax=Eretmocerus hayati TaxID=131215 RepID=A0ACC2PKP0_9HYME|nr:hypothetical protein QAD02_019951 [Eretmocerus hayati]